jgi:hypothetical protein
LEVLVYAIQLRVSFCVALFSCAAGTHASGQQFVRNTTTVPLSVGSTCENVDFADIDLDGDWDAAFACGGSQSQLQNVLWLNQGFAQGGVAGSFVDVTAARVPALLDDSRDIEFVDFDADGDVDLYVSNSSDAAFQGDRVWANMGGLQGGTIGFFQDQTSTRFIGLGGAGSSIAPSQLLAGGNFLDFSSDADFGDIDNDGDLDLVHASDGNGATGSIPTRIFLNDGLGHFTELNPSGFQLAGQDIVDGDPGLWCEGTQLTNTTDASGATCDIAATALGVEIGDIDGDLDLDFLQGALLELPRMFENRLAQSGRFRDVTSTAFAPGYAVGSGHYEQAFGDLDGDLDLDIYGANWIDVGQLEDVTLLGAGDGTFAAPVIVTASGFDDNEADFFDLEGDGDLDVFTTANNSSARIYAGDGTGALTLTTGTVPSNSQLGLDTDLCDFDADGDSDAITTLQITPMVVVLVNTTTGNDTTPPRLSRLEQVPDRQVGPAPSIVRVQVYDNAPCYVTWYNPTKLELTVNGGPVVTIPMRSSMGQIFRGEIPGQLAGTIQYRAVSSDEYGNTGVTPFASFRGRSNGAATCTNGSLGVDHATACPCGNTGMPGHGCGHSSDPNGAYVQVTGEPALDDAVLRAEFLPANAFTLFLQHDALGDTVFHDGVLCASGTLVRLRGRNANAGVALFPDSAFAQDSTTTLSATGGVSPGQGARRYYSAFYRNAASTFCPPATANVSNGWQVDW